MRRALTAFLASTILIPFPARGAQDASLPFVRVAAVSPWLDGTTPFELRVQVANTTELALNDVSVRAAFHPRVTTRSELRTALDEGASSSPFMTMERASEDPIEPGGQRVLTLSEPLDGRITTRGPYPVTISVVYAGGEVSLSTVVPFFPPSEAGRINVAWALPITGPVLTDTGADAVTSLRLTQSAESFAILGARAPAPVTLVPSPTLVDTLVELDAAGATSQASLALANLRSAVASVEELGATTYAPANLPALIAQGPPAEIVRQVTAGRVAIERATGRTPSSTAPFLPADGTLDRDSLAAVVELGIGALIVAPEVARELPTEPAKLEPDKFGPIFPFLLGESETPVLIPDIALDQRLATSSEGVLLGQAIIAETLGAWQELPLYAPERVVLMARAPATPSALATALDGLRSAPWVSLQTVSEAFAGVPPVDRVAAARIPQTERPYLTASRTARAELDALSEIALEPPPDLERLERTLLRAASDTWREDPDAGVALAVTVIEEARAIFDEIRVADRRITLTSRTGDVPLTIVNGNPFDVRVRIELESAKVSFPDGSFVIRDLIQGDNTFSIPVEVLATGSFPIRVAIETADGRRRLTDGTLLVRSTAVSVVSLFVIGGSALFLLLAWTRRAARRNHKPRPTVARAAR